MENFEDLHSFLATYNQEHLLKYWDTLNDDERNELTRDLMEIDFESVVADFKKAIQRPTENKLTDDDIKPVPKSLYKDVNSASADELQYYENVAWEIISESKLAVLVLAGGQGSRLGVSYPKGKQYGKLSFRTRTYDRYFTTSAYRNVRCGLNIS